MFMTAEETRIDEGLKTFVINPKDLAQLRLYAPAREQVLDAD